jgi:hypothetical protein
MPKLDDKELVTRIISSTENGKIDWQKTAVGAQYAASFGGKWIVLIDSAGEGERFWLTLQNSEGETLLRIDEHSDYRLANLFEMARRRALKVDDAIADLLKELGD